MYCSHNERFKTGVHHYTKKGSILRRVLDIRGKSGMKQGVQQATV